MPFRQPIGMSDGMETLQSGEWNMPLFTMLFVVNGSALVDIRPDRFGNMRVHVGTFRGVLSPGEWSWYHVGDPECRTIRWPTMKTVREAARNVVPQMVEIAIPDPTDAPDPINLLRFRDDAPVLRYVPIGRRIRRPSIVRYAGI